MINVYFSYDYELMWGVWPFKGDSYISRNVTNANAALAACLVSHQSAEIPANVAIVGGLLDDSHPREIIWLQNPNKAKRHKLEAHLVHFSRMKHLWKISAWLRRALQSNPYVEIGSHSYGHIFAHDATKAQLELDFAKQAHAFNDAFGLTPKFLILPKNQVTADALEIAKRYEYREVRVNPDNWVSAPERKGWRTRLLRLLDAYLPIQELVRNKPLPFENPRLLEGRFFFRPVHWFAALDWLHFQRLKIGFYYCRATKRDFHIWTHPHNMGADISRAQSNLRRIFAWLKEKALSGEVQFCRMAPAKPRVEAGKDSFEKQAI